MKIEASKPEIIEAWVYGAVGMVQGIYKEYVKEQPILAYMLCGAVGGMVIKHLLEDSAQ